MHTAGQAADAAAADAALEAAAKRAARKERTAPRIRELAGFLVALLFVMGILVAWGYAQNLQQDHPTAGLAAELVFLGLVLWWGLVALSPWLSRLSRRIDDTVEVPPISNIQGLVWAVAILIGVPLAIAQGAWGATTAILVAAASAPTLVLARRRWPRIPNAPLCFSCVAGTVALVPFAIVTDLTREDKAEIASAPPGLVGDMHAEVLARDLRPLVFFDIDENFEFVDVAQAICRKGTKRCDVAQIREYDENMAANAPLPPSENALLPLERGRANAPAGPIYHHVFRDGEKVYIDYWWYFAHNPTPVARGLICGRALTRGWLGEGCAEHAADWEGITIMLWHGCSAPAKDEAFSCITRDGATYEIRQVHYAQHGKVVVYPWTELRRVWLRSVQYLGRRPLVHVALNSHASYPAPCREGSCWQYVHTLLTERRNGLKAWAHNHRCANCVRKIPTNGLGEPASWAAYEKPWGPEPNCILWGAYCDAQPPPRGPALQDRYKDPCDERGADHCLSMLEKFGRYYF